MGFLNGILLFGIAGTLVPLLIHLFQRRKTLRMDFPSLRFLRELNQRQMRRLNLRRILLLIVRMLLVATVAFALARPTLKGGMAAIFPEDAPRSVALIVDRSGSMSLQSEAGTLSEQALARAREVLNRLDASDELRLYALEEQLFDLGGEAMPPSMALELLDDWTTGQGPTRLRAGLAEAMEALAKRPHPLKEVFLISDFAEGALDSARLPEPGDLRIYALPVTAAPSSNGSLLGITRPLRPVLAGRPFSLGLRAGGTGALESFSADLELGGEHRGTLGVGARAGSAVESSLNLNLEQAGQLEGWWRKPRDRFPLDDALPFVLSVESRLDVLLLEASGESPMADYLARALNPYGESAGSRVALSLNRQATERFTAADLENLHLVIMAGGEGLADSGAEALTGFVKRGGGVIIFPDPDGASNLARRLLPRLGGPRSLEVVEGDLLRLGSFQAEHPIFSELGDAHRRVLMEHPFYRTYRSETGSWRVPARFEGGAPAMVAWSQGAGRVRLALFDASPEGGELVWSSMFLPLIHEMAQEAAGAQQPEPLRVGDAIAFPLISEPTEDIRLELLSPEGRRFSPRLDRRSYPLRAVLDRVDAVGIWRLNEISAAGSRPLGMAAVLPPAEESLLRALPADSLPALLGLPNLQVLSSGQNLGDALKAGHFGKEIAATLLLLAVALMLLELWLGRRGPEGDGRI
jgi:hypothetical protein